MTNFRNNLFVFNAMIQKLSKELQISFSNNTKYSDFIGGKHFLRNRRLSSPYWLFIEYFADICC